MDDQDWLAQRFEANRSHLRGVAYRMLGSLTEADDAVQEAWIRPRLRRTDTRDVDNLRACTFRAVRSSSAARATTSSERAEARATARAVGPRWPTGRRGSPS
jgi:DNA-directed RNA polymerase specialized sigma24 family protein